MRANKFNPKKIKAKLNYFCNETGAIIKKGETCIFYPLLRSFFCMDSKQAKEYFNLLKEINQ